MRRSNGLILILLLLAALSVLLISINVNLHKLITSERVLAFVGHLHDYDNVSPSNSSIYDCKKDSEVTDPPTLSSEKLFKLIISMDLVEQNALLQQLNQLDKHRTKEDEATEAPRQNAQALFKSIVSMEIAEQYVLLQNLTQLLQESNKNQAIEHDPSETASLHGDTLYTYISSLPLAEQRALLSHLSEKIEKSDEDNTKPSVDIHEIIKSHIQSFTNNALDTIESSSFNTSDRAQEVIEKLLNLSFAEQKHIVNTVNGREYPYPLSCPNSTILATNYSVVVSYHLGMFNNWRDIARDHFTTLEMCGLGNILHKMFLFYTQNNTDNSFESLTQIVGRYSFASKVTYVHASDIVVPREGPAVNMLRDYCLAEQEHSLGKEIVAFYFHNKGVSHYDTRWREREVFKDGWSYSTALFWRKYLDYYILERPGVCIDYIVNHGVDACGVERSPLDDDSFFYIGNMWAASCRHIVTLNACPMEEVPGLTDPQSRMDLHGAAEGFIGRVSVPRKLNFVSLHNSLIGNLYTQHIPPEEYSDYTYRWLSI